MTNNETIRTVLQADTAVPPGLNGRIVPCRSNGNGGSSEIEWFDASSIQAAGGWVVPETVNEFFYVLETEELRKP